MKRSTIIVVLILAALGVAIFFTLRGRKAEAERKIARTEEVNQITAVPVVTTRVKPEALSAELSYVGTARAQRDVVVLSETSGRIVSLNFNVGQQVRAGQVLLTVDAEVRRAALASAQASAEQARRDVARYETLRRQNTGTEVELERLRLQLAGADAQLTQARRMLTDTRVTAPISGTIASKSVDMGSTLAPGSPIANIVDISRLKVVVNVPEQDVFKLRPGSRVNVSASVYPDARFAGIVSAVSPKADESHTYPVEVTIANSGQTPLKAGMFARVSFTNKGGRALTIPRGALVGSTKSPQVYVVTGGKAMLRKISLAGQDGERLAVAQGLQEGDEVVVSGQINLTDGSEVTVTQAQAPAQANAQQPAQAKKQPQAAR